MDRYNYINIFDTKGIEYLIIIGFLLLIIPFWLLLNKPMYLKEKFANTLRVLSESILKIPQGLFFSKNHTWAHLEPSGIAKIGIDDWLLHITGDIQIKYLIPLGGKIRKGDPIIELNQGEKNLKITSPISGEIQEQNHFLIENPILANTDPYGKAWVYQIKPDNWKRETKSYFLAEEATAWSKQELKRFKDFFAFSLESHYLDNYLVVMQEGGELVDHPLADSPSEVWKDFQKSFLDQDLDN